MGCREAEATYVRVEKTQVSPKEVEPEGDDKQEWGGSWHHRALE